MMVLKKKELFYLVLRNITAIKHDTTLLNVVSTLDLYNTSETRSNQKSFGLNYQKTGKELMSQEEITVMDGGKCIYQQEE